jgi:site-specific recombinase
MDIKSETQALRGYVERVRPSNPDRAYEASAHLRELIEELEASDEARLEFISTVCGCLAKVRIVHALAESGILADTGFFQEFQRRFSAKLLPPALEKNDLRRVIRDVFDQPDDWVWVCGVDTALWAQLVDIVVEEAVSHPRRDIRAAITGLAQRAGALGIDEEFTAKLHEVEDYDSPFLDLSLHAHHFVECKRCQDEPELRDALLSSVRECRKMVIFLRDHKRRYGTSLHLTRVSRRLLQQLDRLELLVSTIAPQSNDELCESIARLISQLVRAEQMNTSIREFVRHSADLVFFQVTEETAKKGQKYITKSAAGYWKFLRKAMAGGVIVGLFALFKNLLAGLPLSLGGQAAVYSLNYAACFVLIYLTGSILATKQPAVTASAIARELDASDDDTAIDGVADIIVAVWRSQFVSFAGNLICAFPTAIGLVYALESLWGVQVADAEKAAYLLKSVDFLGTPALVFAGIAGIYLFLAGVIAGTVKNRIVYTNVRQRIREHPFLSRFDTLSTRVANFVCDHSGMLIGNVALGIMLGTAGTIGTILGLPFDIRHIAFSSAHLGTALISAPELFSWQVFAKAALGVSLIGFVNFLVSFGTTLWMTLESRAVSFVQWRHLIWTLVKRAVTRPLEWYIPSREKPTEPA